MRHLLLLTYSLYFALLMIVPCNHTMLYTNIMQNVFEINMHTNCHHSADLNKENHHHHNDQPNHHHSCTPFCSCGIAHFILNAPPYQTIMAKIPNPTYEPLSLQQKIWTLRSNRCKKLMVNDIWNPPQSS